MPAETCGKSFGRAPGSQEDDEETENMCDARVGSEQQHERSGGSSAPPVQANNRVWVVVSLDSLNLSTATVGSVGGTGSF